LANNIVLLVTIDKFDHNLVIININKLKPYLFIDDRTLQPIFVNLNDLPTKELVENVVIKLIPIKHVINHHNDTHVGMNVGIYLIGIRNPK
jgi:hypothetical protein